MSGGKLFHDNGPATVVLIHCSVKLLICATHVQVISQ